MVRKEEKSRSALTYAKLLEMLKSVMAEVTPDRVELIAKTVWESRAIQEHEKLDRQLNKEKKEELKANVLVLKD